MAKQDRPKLTKKETSSSKAETQSPKKKDSLYLICGFISLILSVYLCISLVSYLFSWAEDQSLLDNADFLNTFIDTENEGVKLGLVLSNFLIFNK